MERISGCTIPQIEQMFKQLLEIFRDCIICGINGINPFNIENQTNMASILNPQY